MPAPTPDDLWQALVRSRLIEAGAAAALRAEHAARPRSTAGDGSAPAIAAWLVSRGTLSRWQAKQLLTGSTAPFFLGAYRLVERHERAGDTLVFTARHEPTGRAVTLVVLNAKRCRDPLVWDAITIRAATAARAKHPMLLRTWSLEQVDAARFVVCEPVRGESLADEVDRLGPLPPREAGLVALEAAEAVAELHALGGVHGGLSLDALVREPSSPGSDPRSGRVRLLQFPLASDPHVVPLRPPQAAPDAGERVRRREAFLAPELAAAAAECHAPSDVYALGAVLQALLTGSGPNRDGAGSSPPSAVPPALAAVAQRMLAHDPARRPRGLREAAAALSSCLDVAHPVAADAAASRPAEEPAPGAAAFDFATASPTRGRATRRRAVWLPWVGIGASALLAAGTAVVLTSRGGERRRSRPIAARTQPADGAQPDSIDAVAPAPLDLNRTARPTSPVASPSRRVEDDPALPWASPTAGSPPTLAFLLPGAEAVLLVRLADVAADEEGRLFLRSLGPAVEAAIDRLVALCGGDVSAIESVQMAWLVEEGDEVVGTCSVRFAAGRAAPEDAAARERAWGPTTRRVIDDEQVFEGETLSFWSPRAERGRVLVMTPTSTSADGDSSPMERMIRDAGPLAADESLPVRAVVPVAMEALVGMLDADRHLTLIASPQSVLRTGRALLAGPLAPLAAPLDSICGESIQAAGLSLHFGDTCYVELDAVPAPDVMAKRLATDLARSVAGLSDRIASQPAAFEPDSYGRAVVLRLPAMLRVVAERVRSGSEGEGAVLNAYLPRHAAHNITLAAELALAQVAGWSDPAAGLAPPAGPGNPPGDP